MEKLATPFQEHIHYRDLDMYSVLYHPKYFELCDNARNQAFKEFGYPIEDQLKDKVGFTVGGITDVVFRRPIFMDEKIFIFTKFSKTSTKSCLVEHWIQSCDDHEKRATTEIFKAKYNLVFVSIGEVAEYPLNISNIQKMKVVNFNSMAQGIFELPT